MSVGEDKVIGDGPARSDASRAVYTVGLLGVEADPATMYRDHVANLRLDEIERRILAIEAKLPDE